MTTATTKNRLGWQAETIRSASQSTPTLPPLRATGRVRLDLTTRDEGLDTDREILGRIKALDFAPAGCEVVLAVAPAQLWPGEGIAYLRDNCQHLGAVVVECSDPRTVRSWVRALRGEYTQ